MNKMFFSKLLLLLGVFVIAQSADAAGAAPGSLLNLLGDRKALAVGDVLLVQIVETSSATAGADTTTAKKNTVGLGIVFPNTTKNISGDLEGDFSGQAKISRSGKVLAQISVVITAVDPAGLMSVHGHQFIEINGDKQEIELSGSIRPEDISDGNSILSSRIADAKIRYVGDGVLAETQRPGWVVRLLSWLGVI